MGNPPSEDELNRRARELRVYTIELHALRALRLDTLTLPLGWRLVDEGGALSLEAEAGVSRAHAWQLCHELVVMFGADALEAYPFSEPVRSSFESGWSLARPIAPQPSPPLPLIASFGFTGSTRDDVASSAVDLGWHLETIKLSASLLDSLSGAPKVQIGHLDTGFSTHHEVRDVYTSKRLPRHEARFGDGGSPAHGTHTASVLASRKQGSQGDVLGVAPHALLYPVRVHKRVILAPWNMDELAQGIYEAVEEGCGVISISMGGPIGRGVLRKAVAHAVSRGVIIVAAAGQLLDTMDARWLPGGVTVPGSYDEVITAAACEGILEMIDGKPRYKLKVARWSARGPEVDIIAPGWPIAIASWEDGHEGKDDRTTIKQSWGTSYATAQTAGVAALWLAKHHEALEAYPLSDRPRLFKEALSACSGAQVEGWNKDEWGVGLLDAEAILAAPLPTAPAALRGGQVSIAAGLTDEPLDGLLDRMWTQISRSSDDKLTVDEARRRLVRLLTSRQLWRADLSPDMEEEAIDLVLRDAALRDGLPNMIARDYERVNVVHISPIRLGIGLMSLGASAEPRQPETSSQASPALLAALSNKT